jgi:ParB-like chromosome segregation protein Spo0J
MQFVTADVKDLHSAVPASEFSKTQIEELAQSIVTSGLLRPIVIRMINIESYEVVANHLGFHAAVRAKELSPRECEMVNCFVVNAEEAAQAKVQLAIYN